MHYCAEMAKRYYVYMMTNKRHGTLYVGVTGNLAARVNQHRSLSFEGFTKKYRLTRLVWLEIFADIHEALSCEKYLKRRTRQTKIALIEQMNPSWQDLGENLVE
jgi:putative endonuclease